MTIRRRRRRRRRTTTKSFEISIIVSKSANIKRYEQRLTQYRQTRLSESQKKVYKGLNGETRDEDVIRDARESKEFWKDICEPKAQQRCGMA